MITHKVIKKTITCWIEYFIRGGGNHATFRVNDTPLYVSIYGEQVVFDYKMKHYGVFISEFSVADLNKIISFVLSQGELPSRGNNVGKR